MEPLGYDVSITVAACLSITRQYVRCEQIKGGDMVWMAVIFLVINAVVEFSYSLLNPWVRRGKEGT